jgi:hypothetical protein
MAFVWVGSHSEYAQYGERSLKISLVGENKFEGSLLLTPLMGRFEDKTEDRREPEWAPTLLFLASQVNSDRE